MAIVSIKNIICDPQVMPREKIDENHVNELVEDLNSTAVFPPVDLFYDGKHYYVADGYHRIEAFKKAGRDEIDATVHKGDKPDALWFACGANASHGKRRTNKDKRKAVKNLLMDPKWRQKSDVTIAEHCKVSQPFVLKVRCELESTYNDYKSPSCRKTKTGGIMETKNIGKGGSNSINSQKTVAVSMVVNKDDLPPKPSAKIKPNEKNDNSDRDQFEVSEDPQDYKKVLTDAHKLLKNLETTLWGFKKALSSIDESNSLSEIDLSDHWKKMKQSWTDFAVFYAKNMTIRD
jgi:hypothetical protein